MNSSTVALACGLLLSGCATAANQITTASVSTVGYSGMSCPQLEAEAHRVAARANDLGAQQDAKANQDAIVMGVTLLVFWPAAFAIQGNGATAAELSRMKGELVAMEQVSVSKGCQIAFPRFVPPPPPGPPPRSNPT